jgi:hypothetical protein
MKRLTIFDAVDNRPAKGVQPLTTDITGDAIAAIGDDEIREVLEEI